MMQPRRHPLEEGSLVLHMDGRLGRVVALGEVDGLPGARVQWAGDGEETLPLGFLERADRGGLE